jgi:flagellin-like hook-associated protein FlgL
VLTAPSYNNTQENKGWTLGFTMPGIGNVTATSTSISYSSGASMRIDKYEDIWWEKKNYGGSTHYYTLSYTPSKGSNGTLLGVTDCITDSAHTRPAGYENAEWSGGRSITKDTEKGGTITLSFNLNADKAYTYTYTDAAGNTTSRTSGGTSVGTLTMTISVSHSDTEETIMKKMAAALNQSSSVVDIYEGSESSGKSSSTTAYAYSATAKSHKIDVPLYKSTLKRYIQVGANAYQGIDLVYDSLRIQNLGIASTDTLTQENAEKAIDEVQSASEIVSAQRSLFGAYQNRMEHAKEVDEESEENLQASESKIRDADMAQEAMALARDTILEQASQAMLANANQSTQGILTLLTQ